jgi:cholesterol transport system auxiliary component
MNQLIFSTLIASVLLLSGCGLSQPPAQFNNYIIADVSINKTYAQINDSLRIDRVRSIEPYNNKEMIYQVSDVKFESDYYNRFLSEPEELLASQIASWFKESNLYGSVYQQSISMPANQILQVVITKLYGDFRENQSPAAILELQFVLIDNNAPRRPTAIMEKTLSSRIEIAKRDPSLLAKAYGLALTDILQQFANQQ